MEKYAITLYTLIGGCIAYTWPWMVKKDDFVGAQQSYLPDKAFEQR